MSWGKPRIIGVHHLMSLLKDGDVIEIDTSSGIVKILSCYVKRV